MPLSPYAKTTVYMQVRSWKCMSSAGNNDVLWRKLELQLDSWEFTADPSKAS